MIWTTAYIDSLPDSSFAVIDADGKRHLPYKDKDGKVDLPHLRNALARLDQTNISAEEKAKARTKLENAAKEAGVGEHEMYQNIYVFESKETAWDFDESKNLFKKEVARTGSFIDRHGVKVNITTEYFDELIRNFKSGDDIPIPLGHDGMHDPKKNTGYVVSLERDGDKLMAVMDIKDPETATKIKQKTIKGVSIGVMLSEKVGRVLNHIALTLSPAISQLADFVALEKLNMVVFEFEKQDTEQKIEDEKILAEGFGKVIDVLSERLTKSK